MKIKKFNVLFQNIDATKQHETNEKDKQKETVDNQIPTETTNQDPKSPKNQAQKLGEKISEYKTKIEGIKDETEKEQLSKSLKTVEDFIKKHNEYNQKTLSDILNKVGPEKEEIQNFVNALRNLSSKFDKKETKIPEEMTEKLKKMNNNEFLKIPAEERLKYITKEHKEAKDVKEGDNLTFTFTFDGEYNQALWRKTTAGQVLPENVNAVKSGNKEYKRHGLKGEFFTDNGKRLIINEGTSISIQKPLTKEEIEKIQNKNELIYKAYMGELKKDEVPENQQKDFFDKDGKLLKKYKLTDKEKKLFKKYDFIAKEAIERNIDPKLVMLVADEVVKGKNLTDKNTITTLEDMFTEFDRIKPSINMWNGKMLDNGKYPDEYVVKILKKFGGEKWEEKAKEYGLDENKIKQTSKRIIANELPNVNLEQVDNEKIKKMLDYALSLTKMGKAGIIGAKHCTDWVSKVWERTVGINNADSGKVVWNGWHGHSISYAPESVKKEIKPGDYVVIQHPNGGTHGVIALGPVDSKGYLPTVSYPNGGKPPRVHSYGPEHKIIRVKRAIV